MDQEFLINRLKEIEQGIVQTTAQHSALHGAKSEILNLLKNMGEAMATGITNAAVESATGMPGVGTMASEIINDVIEQTQEKHD